MPNAKLIATADLPKAVSSAIETALKRAALAPEANVSHWHIIGRQIKDLAKANEFAHATVDALKASGHPGIEPVVMSLPGGGHTAGFFPVDKLMKL